MSVFHRVAAGFMLLLTGLALGASYYGWGLPTDASVRARNVRQGSLRGRSYYGGGPGFGK